MLDWTNEELESLLSNSTLIYSVPVSPHDYRQAVGLPPPPATPPSQTELASQLLSPEEVRVHFLEEL